MLSQECTALCSGMFECRHLAHGTVALHERSPKRWGLQKNLLTSVRACGIFMLAPKICTAPPNSSTKTRFVKPCCTISLVYWLAPLTFTKATCCHMSFKRGNPAKLPLSGVFLGLPVVDFSHQLSRLMQKGERAFSSKNVLRPTQREHS